MSQVLAVFGIDWRLLIINAVNFALLLFVLWYFLYAPLTSMLETRRQKVAQGVRDAEEAQKKLHAIEASKAGILAQAGREADEVLQNARAAALMKEKEILAASERAAALALKDAEAQAQEMKLEAIAQSKQEVAKLIVLGINKMSAQK